MAVVFGVILAGGRSRRFGSEKAAASLGGATLLERAHARLSTLCQSVAVSAPETSRAATLAQALGAPVLADPRGAPPGPLSGVLSALHWAAAGRAELLVTAPCDAPLLPDDLAARLVEGLGSAPAAVARTSEGLQPLCAVWRTGLARALGEILQDGRHPAVKQVLADAGAAEVLFPDAGAFANVNTPQDLEAAAARLGA